MKTKLKRFYRDTDYKTYDVEKGFKQLDALFKEILAEFDKWVGNGQILLGVQWRRHASYTDNNWSVELEVLYQEQEPVLRDFGEILL